MSKKQKIDAFLNVIFYLVAGLVLGNFLSVAYGCAAVKPACSILNLADMACEMIAVEVIDPETGKRETVQLHKSALTGAVVSAKKKEVTK